MSKKYLDSSELANMISAKDLALFSPCSADSIDEKLLQENVLKTGRATDLCFAAVQMAIVGQGGKELRDFKGLDGKVQPMAKLFKDCGVDLDFKENARLEPGKLTARRLIRVFRYQTLKVLKANKNYSSSLNTKWSGRDEKSQCMVFPGAEHLCDSDEHSLMLVAAYTELDKRLLATGKVSGICDRVVRVLTARGFKTK